MTDQLTHLHETWLGMVQPVEGLVVSVPVLADKMVGRPDETPAALQEKLLSLESRWLDDRLASIQREIETEPPQIQSLYDVALVRLVPVGLVILWPETRG